jgi:hypothetical protein
MDRPGRIEQQSAVALIDALATSLKFLQAGE